MSQPVFVVVTEQHGAYCSLRTNNDDGQAALSQLGEVDEASRLLEVAYAERSRGMPWLGAERIVEPLRDDPRFAELLRRMSLPDARASLPR